MTQHYGLLIWVPPFTSFMAEWWAGYMRRTIPRNALALSGNYCIAGATAIPLPTTNGQKQTANSPIYNLAGQRVDTNYKGLVIKNGKKTINK